MKIFDKVERFEEKVNFVDENNVYLGYSMDQCCCENADWFIANEPSDKIMPRTIGADADWSGWTFDPDYFRSVYNDREFDGGGMVIFRIVNGEREMFIHLYNVQNGYYGHGFTFEIDGKKVRDDCL